MEGDDHLICALDDLSQDRQAFDSTASDEQQIIDPSASELASTSKGRHAAPHSALTHQDQ
jgi:hypothetical protein